MQEFSFQKTAINSLTLITPRYIPDNRGYLSKPFEKNIFASHGVALSPWEELRSCSHKGVLRGLHFQRRHSQDKLVQVLHGAVYDVAVDLREGSETFGKWADALHTQRLCPRIPGVGGRYTVQLPLRQPL